MHYEGRYPDDSRAGYSRLVARCPLHGQHVCKKTRVFGAKGSALPRDQEPVAFLGCWLQASCRFANADEHKSYKPTRAEVEAYAAASLS